MADNEIAPAPGADSVYHLTLVITTNNYFNNTSDQPAYFVFQNGSLLSSANLVLPQDSLIQVTIMNYDDGNATVPSVYQNVAGTTGNQITVINNTMVNATETNNGIQIHGAWTTSNVPLSDIAHTFTVSGLNLSVPVPVSSIVQFSFQTGSPGTFTWQCYAECGAGASGWGQSMHTPGWMTGTISVQ